MTSRNRNSDISDREGNHCMCQSKRKTNSTKYGTEVKLGDSRRAFPVDQHHDIKITSGNSEVTVSTQKTRGTNNRAGCTNVSDCPRMRNFTTDGLLSQMSEQDWLRLEDAIKQACDSISQPKTFEEVEELAEIQNFTEIQQKLTNLINDKRNKLERNRARREAELLERKQDFHKRVMDRVKRDNLDMSTMHQRLLETLGGQGNRASSSSSREELEITHSQTFPSGPPQAESTRIYQIKHKLPRQAHR